MLHIFNQFSCSLVITIGNFMANFMTYFTNSFAIYLCPIIYFKKLKILLVTKVNEKQKKNL